MELPGYRPLNLQIDVTPDGDDSVSIDEELERRERLPYEKLPAVYDRTTSEVEFAVTPADAGVSEEGKALGTASDFGPASPLKLSGPRGPRPHAVGARVQAEARPHPRRAERREAERRKSARS